MPDTWLTISLSVIFFALCICFVLENRDARIAQNISKYSSTNFAGFYFSWLFLLCQFFCLFWLLGGVFVCLFVVFCFSVGSLLLSGTCCSLVCMSLKDVTQILYISKILIPCVSHATLHVLFILEGKANKPHTLTSTKLKFLALVTQKQGNAITQSSFRNERVTGL